MATNRDAQPLIKSKNYLDLNNKSCNLEDQVVLEVKESSSSEDEQNVSSREHKNCQVELMIDKSQQVSLTLDDQKHLDEVIQEPQAEDTIDILRGLLSIERLRNKQRRHNYKTLQGYLTLLQTDYLRLAEELVDTLELSKKIKNEKDVCIANLESTLRDQEQQIRELNVATSDAQNLRDNFNELLKNQIEVEKDQYEKQKQVLEQQIIRERVNNSHLLQQFQDRLDEQDKCYRIKTNLNESRLKVVEQERDLLLTEPQNEVVRFLREEKISLMNRVDELEYANQQASSKYENLRRKCDSLQAEVEQLEHQSKEELVKIQEAHHDLNVAHQEVLMELESENEVIQVLQNNLSQSERRAINLLSTLKDKEVIWEKLLKQTEMKHEESLVKTKSQLRAMNKKVSELEVQIEQKQNDLVRCQLEQENQLDSIRSDRDVRLNKLQLEKNKLEQMMDSIGIKLNSEIDHKTRLLEENSKLSKDISQLRKEKERLSMELSRVEALAEGRLRELDSLVDNSKNPSDRLTNANHLNLDFEEMQRANERLEKRVKELKKDNQKLLLKLKVNESSLLNITNTIRQEQTKLTMEHEKKLESIRQQQVAYDKSQTKYRRYGFKLKKYCEHLSLVHKHLCNPLECGYQVLCNQDLKFCIKKT